MSLRINARGQVVSGATGDGLRVDGVLILPGNASQESWFDDDTILCNFRPVGDPDDDAHHHAVLVPLANPYAYVIIAGASNWLRTGGGVMLRQGPDGLFVLWTITGIWQRVEDVYCCAVSPEGVIVTADQEKSRVTVRTQDGAPWSLPTPGGLGDSEGGLDPDVSIDSVFLTVRAGRTTTLYRTDLQRPASGWVANRNLPTLTRLVRVNGEPCVLERTEQLTLRGLSESVGVVLAPAAEPQFWPAARAIASGLKAAWWAGSGLVPAMARGGAVDLATLPQVDVVSQPAVPPVDTTTPFPKLPARAWMAFWKTETPDDNYGRVDSPCNTVMLEGRSYDPALHGSKAILCGDPAAGVPTWNGATGLVGVPVSMEANKFNLDAIKAGRAKAIAACVPETVNADGTAWKDHPDWIEQAEALRQPGDGWELQLMDELYPKPGEAQSARYARWREICAFHRDRFRTLARRWAVTVSCYPQAQPGPDGFPKPGVGFPIHQIAEDQRELASILAELGEGCALVMVFSDLRYGGMSWTYPDGSRPLVPFRQLWADANPAGSDPVLVLPQGISASTAPPVTPPAEPQPVTTYAAFVQHELPTIMAVWQKKHHVVPNASDHAHQAWRRLIEQAPLDQMLRDL